MCSPCLRCCLLLVQAIVNTILRSVPMLADVLILSGFYFAIFGVLTVSAGLCLYRMFLQHQALQARMPGMTLVFAGAGPTSQGIIIVGCPRPGAFDCVCVCLFCPFRSGHTQTNY